MDEQRIREIVREEMKRAAEEQAAEIHLKVDGKRLVSLVSPFLKSNRGKPPRFQM